jgi:hypothetical protein
VGQKSTIVPVLKVYHRDVEGLFDLVLAYEGRPDRIAGVLPKLFLEVVRHMVYEDGFLEPVVQGLPEGPSLVAAERERHERVFRSLHALERTTLAEAEFRDALAAAARDFRAHVVCQERDVFPALEATVDKEALETMARWLSPTIQVGPTYSYPTSAISDPSRVAWPQIGLTDRLTAAVADEITERAS